MLVWLFNAVFCCASFDLLLRLHLLVCVGIALFVFVVPVCDLGYFDLIYAGCLIDAAMVTLYCLLWFG